MPNSKKRQVFQMPEKQHQRESNCHQKKSRSISMEEQVWYLLKRAGKCFSSWNLYEQYVLYACQVTVQRACFFVRNPEYICIKETASIIF